MTIAFHGANMLECLRNVRWDTVANTYGSSHATLIGLLVDWWISSDSDTHPPDRSYVGRACVVGGTQCLDKASSPLTTDS